MRDQWEMIKNYRERLKDNKDLTDRDVELIRTFSERLELHNSEYTNSRHRKLLGHIIRLAEGVEEFGGILDERGIAEDVVRYINRTYENEEYNRDHRIALRVFGRRVAETDDTIKTDGDGIPETLRWISTTYSRNYDPSPKPENMLRWDEDIKPMIDACRNSRDKAYIALAWDLGPRPSEMHVLDVGNISDHKYGLKVTIENGKTGTRSPLIVPAVPYVNRWLADHPGRGDPDAPLWSQLESVTRISDRMERKLLNKAADRAGITRPVTRRNFRKSSASYLASQNLNQSYIEEHHGWVTGSRIAARYVAVFGDQTDTEIAKVHGVEIDDTDSGSDIGPITCTRCQRETPPDEPTCMWCGQVINHAGAAQIKTEQTEVRSELLSIVQNNPVILERVDELERLFELADQDPSVILNFVDNLE